MTSDNYKHDDRKGKGDFTNNQSSKQQQNEQNNIKYKESHFTPVESGSLSRQPHWWHSAPSGCSAHAHLNLAAN